MKSIPIVAVLILGLVISACGPTATLPAVQGPPLTRPAQATDAGPTLVLSTPTNSNEIQQIAEVVQGIGSKLQSVSLLSPTAAADIQTQYAQYVSPPLLEQWAVDPSHAPGRMTSSPWPDHIQIQSMQKTAENEMVVKAEIVEVTSVEANSGGAAATLPVEITLQKNAQGTWWITNWTQGQ